jgi:diaminopimelate decarboxylase
MNTKTFPLTKAALEAVIAAGHPTPFCIYDEAGIRATVRRIKKAFSILPGYTNHFAVKALPNPAILKILTEEGFGADCSSLSELELARRSGIAGEQIMFTSNETPAGEYRRAKALGAVINLDDITHIDFLEKTAGIPDLVSLRFNPGSEKVGNAIIGNPVEAKYGLTRDQIHRAYLLLHLKGANRFGLHTMVASNELNLDYHLETGKMLFELAVDIYKNAGLRIEFINLGGGVGIPYKPGDSAVDYEALSGGLRQLYDDIIVPAGLGDGPAPLGIRTEWGRAVTGPHGWLVARAIHRKDIYRHYIGLDATAADFMRPAIYGAYHHISVAGKENEAPTETYDIVGSLCENSDKFAVQRKLPAIRVSSDSYQDSSSSAALTADRSNDDNSGDLIILHDAGAHGRAMGFNYNGRLRCAELLLHADGAVTQIRRAETLADYFATLDFTE